MAERPWIPAAILVAGALIGIAWANLDHGSYHAVWSHALPLEFGPFEIALDLHGWVNDGLMVLFFLSAGVEIKRELVRGELRSPRAAALPALAALGGMLVPIAIFVLCRSLAPPEAVPGIGSFDGWAIPVATDAAFALGILALAGPRVPAHLKLFLLTLAIADDVGGILIIATVFTDGLSMGALALAGSCVLVIFGMRLVRVDHPLAYVPVCGLMWYFTLKSGVHATIAGVVSGLLVPGAPMHGVDVIDRVDDGLRPIVTYIIFPLFAIANTGIELHGEVLAAASTSPIFWGVLLGLVFGKAIGIAGATALAVKLGLGTLPSGVRMGHIPAVGLLGGIGFTVAIFVANLSLPEGSLLGEAKLAILLGSCIASIAGLAALRHVCRGGERP